MDVMEMLQFADELKSLLVQHDRAVRQILIIDDYIGAISWQALCTAISGHTNQVLHLLLRKSVAEGVKKMYKHYRLQKWFKVQLLLQNVLRVNNRNNHEHLLSLPTQIFDRYPELNRLGVSDTIAHTWGVRHCEFFRFC